MTRLSRLDPTKDQSGAGVPHPTVMMREGKRALGNLELRLDVGGGSGGYPVRRGWGTVIQSQTGSELCGHQQILCGHTYCSLLAQ